MSSLPIPPRGGTQKSGVACLTIFIAPFCCVGLLTAVLAVQELLDGNLETGGFMALFATVFGGASFGFLAMVFKGRSVMRKQAALQASSPAEPWKWREDWAAGFCRGETKQTVYFLWGFAVLWNLISWPIAMFLPSEITEKQNYAALLGLLFPLVGIGLLVWAVRQTMELRKFGQSVFRMAGIPGVVGGDLSGEIDIPTGLTSGQDVNLTLSCVNRVRTGSGKNSSTSETILWQDERREVKTMARPEAMGAGVPVQFAVPSDCRETNTDDSDNVILWRLEARAAVPGVDYHGQFEVPVFKTAGSGKEAAKGAWRPELPPGYRPSPESWITVGTGATGGTEYLVQNSRSTRMVVSTCAFILVWTAITVGITMAGAPLIFPFVFGFFDVLMLLFLLQLLFGESRILIESGAVTITNTIALFSTRSVIPVSELQAVKPSIGVQAGRSVRHTLTFARSGGSESRLWVSLRDKRDAEWLAAEILRQAGRAS